MIGRNYGLPLYLNGAMASLKVENYHIRFMLGGRAGDGWYVTKLFFS